MMLWPLPVSRNSVRHLRIQTIAAAIVLHAPLAAVGAETPSFDCVIDPSQTVRRLSESGWLCQIPTIVCRADSVAKSCFRTPRQAEYVAEVNPIDLRQRP